MADAQTETATLGGGCFWCTEAVFAMIDGVGDVRPGYSGGHVERPTYEQVCGKKTGHAEVVQVTFDPQKLSYRDVLEIFFASHDPTTKDRQGNDTGPQYRSVILTHSPEQRATAEQVIREFDADNTFGAPIVTEIADFERFWPAEREHLDYYRRNPMQPYCAFVISPKVAKIRKKFTARLKSP
ncbi:MAG TPA: peptide-methionine (S)-S-oxide reductase MsrA [Gemmatimonadaceae bacterium]|nr:peptide-methionine (S)-S-oxide reductase MsrA [Gemmatimonadaceae bacterium]